MSPSIAPEVQAALLTQTAIDLVENSADPKTGALTALHLLRRIAELLPAVPNINRTALTPVARDPGTSQTTASPTILPSRGVSQ